MPDSHPLAGLRLGSGYALAELGAARPLRLAGVELPGLPGAEGDDQDDGDAVCRAVVEALLHAAGLPGLAAVFPEEHPDRYYADGLVLLSRTATALLRSTLGGVLQCNVQVFHARPELLRGAAGTMRSQLATALQVELPQVALGIHSLPGQAAQPVPGEAAALASLLGVLRPGAGQREPAAAVPRAPRSRQELQSTLAELEGFGGGGEGPRATAPVKVEEEYVPERVKQFERSVRSKLHPLPPAPRPPSGAQLIIYCDGASRGNPGPASTGYVVLDDIGRLVHEGGSALGEMTNNQAEYRAVLEAAQWIEQHLGREYKLEFRLDSQLVQRQLTGEYKIKDSVLKDLALHTMNALMYFWQFKVIHVPREENSRADALANRALDGGRD
jgi:2-C-methyl-D-erythritol 2,4-cyclodiphosphate synthase